MVKFKNKYTKFVITFFILIIAFLYYGHLSFNSSIAAGGLSSNIIVTRTSCK